MLSVMAYEEFTMPIGPLVALVDDDESVRDSLPALLRECGFEVQVFISAEAFLASGSLDRINCLILDVSMPGMSGPELQQELRLHQRSIPIIFITGDADDAVRSRLLKQGAVECLSKPFSDTALLKALDLALRGR
jgi:FixJ family two-component response regulator